MDKQFKKFINKQIQEIRKFKWIESEKAKRDLGESAVEKWVGLYAKNFRGKYEVNELKVILKHTDNVINKLKDPNLKKRFLLIERELGSIIKFMEQDHQKNGKSQ